MQHLKRIGELMKVFYLLDCISGYYVNSGTCTVCAADTYKTGTSTATSCTSCGTGHSTNGATQSTSSAACTR